MFTGVYVRLPLAMFDLLVMHFTVLMKFTDSTATFSNTWADFLQILLNYFFLPLLVHLI